MTFPSSTDRSALSWSVKVGERPLEEHDTPAISVRHADGVTLNNCKVAWGKSRPDYFTHALEIENATAVDYAGLKGEAAHPERDKAVMVR